MVLPEPDLPTRPILCPAGIVRLKSLNTAVGAWASVYQKLRFSKEMLRKGEMSSFVEICMYEPKSEFSVDGNIIVSREIGLNGRNMCKINGRMVTVNELKDFMKKFI